MKLDLIRSLLDYDRWASARLYDLAAALPEEVTRERVGAGFDSIHGTLAHIVGAEAIWLSRCRGSSPRKLMGSDDYPSLSAIHTRWLAQQQALDAFLFEIVDAQLDAELRYTNTHGKEYEYPLWQILVHMVNHGTHHRAELAEMLTRAGLPPPAMDLLVYYDELNEAAA